MKTLLKLVVICIFQFVTLSGYGQSAKINLNLHDVALREAFGTIESISEYRFFFSDDFSSLKKKVNIITVNASIEEVMSKLLANSQLNYKIAEKNLIIIVPDRIKKKRVMGRVTESNGQALVDVNVALKGTQQVTRTDEKGMYTIDIPGPNNVLQFSYMGYEPAEVSVHEKSIINVTLAEKFQSLQQIVIVGFGMQMRGNVTGSISTVSGRTLEARPVVNIGQALEGMVPGLNITQSGQLGGSLENRPSMNIRGIATIGQGSTGGPLILIDGMEGDINTINPQDIDNISVLKDAAASSIYGSRAPFGVILVTTKKGQTGRARVTYNNNFRWCKATLLPKMMDSYTFALFFNDANKNSGNGDFFSPERVQRILDFQSGKLGNKTTIPNPSNPQYWADGYIYGNDNVDWFKAVYKNAAPSQEHAININGGTDDITYYLSGDYLNQEGLMKLSSDNYQRYTTTAKINTQITNWASVLYSVRFTREDYVRPAALSNNFNSELARQGWPILPLYDPNGYLYSSPSQALALRDGGRDRMQDDWIYQQLKITVEPIKGWKIFTNFNYKTEDYFRHWDVEKTYNHDVNGSPVIFNASSSVHEEALRTNYFNPNFYSEYTGAVEKNHYKIMIGYQSELNKYRSLYAERNGVMVASTPVIDVTSGTDNDGKVVSPRVGGQYQNWATAGFFSRLNYDYEGRYLIETNLRYDGTSRYRSGQRWNLFPSVSLGWTLSKEPLWNRLKQVVNNVKIRYSYGQLGNQNTRNWYPTYNTMQIGNGNSSWLVNGIQLNTSVAPGIISSSLTWERVKTNDLGIDLGFLKNQLTSTFDYFVRNTNDMIGNAPELPAILGTPVPTTNNTDLKTYGFELTIAWQDRLKNGLGYSAKLMFSDSQTEITNYPNPAGNLSTYYAGQKIGEIWGYTTIGIAKTQAEMDAHLASLPNGGQTALGSSWKAGDIMFKDLNGDGKIDAGSSTTGNHGDLSIIGNSTPRYSFGIDLRADWKGFDFRIFLQGVLKRDYFQNSYYFWGASGQGVYWSTGLKEQTDYFRDDPNHPLGLNLNSYYPRPLFNGKNQQIQTRYLQNAAYIRFKNLQLGYTLPQVVSKKIGLKKCRIYVSGENIWTWTRLSTIFDPETIDGGWGGNVYPLSKVLSVGLSVNL
ncbi:MAG: TonB-dependent receptor [Bacteroidetes bacterium]|nr:TonB-dependent receptor [Bacteroidota bacterium]